MTRTDKIQENLDDEVHCWSQVPLAGSVTVNVSLKFLWKDKTHEKKEIASKVKVHMKTIRRLKIAEDFKSCCRVLLMPQGLVRQMYPVQKHSRLPFLLHSRNKEDLSRQIVGSKKMKKTEENGRQWMTIDKTPARQPTYHHATI